MEKLNRLVREQTVIGLNGKRSILFAPDLCTPDRGKIFEKWKPDFCAISDLKEWKPQQKMLKKRLKL